MRRNLITLFLAAALAAACNITDPVPEVRLTGDELGLEAVAAPPTKGFVEGTTLLDTPFDRVHSAMEDADKVPRTVVLSSWLYPQSGAGEDYLRDAVFAYDGGLWHHDPKVYWPLGARLDFLAYSSSLDLPSTAVSWHPDRCTARLTLQVDRRFTADDLMYAYAAPRAASSGTAVQMRFAHSQAWLQFALRATDGGVVTVDKVVLEDVYTSGALTVEPDGAAARGAWDFSRETGDDLAVEDAAGNTRFGLGAAAQHLDVLLPQQQQRDIVIWYHLAGSDRQLKYRVEAPVAHWVAGNRYAYDVTVTNTAVTVGATVEPWDATTVDTSDNEIRGTGSAVDRIGEDFDFTADSRFLWRVDDTEEYEQLDAADAEGDWGLEVSWPCGDYVVTLRNTGSGYQWSFRRDWAHEPLTFEVLTAGEIYISSSNNNSKTLRYTVNGGEMQTLSYTRSGSIPVEAGDVVKMYATGGFSNTRNTASFGTYTPKGTRILTGSGCTYNVCGNVKSIMNDQDDKCPFGLFYGNTGVISAENMVLPDYDMDNNSSNCPAAMFYNCTALTTAPASLGTISHTMNMAWMFFGCTALTDVPDLNMGKIYAAYMFYGCTSLVHAPRINATEIGSCESMFRACTSLTDVQDELPVMTLGTSAYNGMFYGCTSLVRAPRLPATTLGYASYQDMFRDCTSLTDVQAELPCTALSHDDGADYVYCRMFCGCTSLTRCPVLPSLAVGYSGYEGMFYGCTSLTSSCDLPATSIWCKSYYEMFYGCTAMTTAMEVLPAETVFGGSYGRMFMNCTSLRKGPEIMASQLSDISYLYRASELSSMFECCTSMTECTSEIRLREFGEGTMSSMFFRCSALLHGPKLRCESIRQRTAGTYSTSSLAWAFAECTSMVDIDFTYVPEVVYANGLIGTFFACGSLTGNIDFDFHDVRDNGCTALFYGCRSMGSMPSLTITTVAGNGTSTMSHHYLQDYYYYHEERRINSGYTGSLYAMFEYCGINTGLAIDVNLSAITEYPAGCCGYMFSNTAITAAPPMNACTAGKGSFEYMFYNDRNLVSPPADLDILSIGENSCQSMFEGCHALVSAPLISATNSASSSFNRMFKDCWVLAACPDLHFKDVANSACYEMFSGCNTITATPDITFTSVGNSGCYSMFYNCNRLVTASANIPAATLSENALRQMFYGCTSLVNAPDILATTVNTWSCGSMFSGCEKLRTAPVLRATTLATRCYELMFWNCRLLDAVTMLATDISANNCLNGWLSGVASSGTLTKDASMTSLPAGNSGVPSGWTVVDY